MLQGVIVQLKELESRLEESNLRATKYRESSKEPEEELLLYKKETVEYHEKGFKIQSGRLASL